MNSSQNDGTKGTEFKKCSFWTILTIDKVKQNYLNPESRSMANFSGKLYVVGKSINNLDNSLTGVPNPNESTTQKPLSWETIVLDRFSHGITHQFIIDSCGREDLLHLLVPNILKEFYTQGVAANLKEPNNKNVVVFFVVTILTWGKKNSEGMWVPYLIRRSS